MKEHHDKSVKQVEQKQELTRALAELEVARHKIADLKSLIQVSSMINSNIDSHRLLEMIVDTAKNVTKSEGAALLLWDAKKIELRYEAVVGDKGGFVNRNQKVCQEEGVVGWVAHHKIPVYVADVKKDPRFAHYAAKDLGIEVHSVIAVPMISRDKFLGVLEAVNPSLKRFVAQEAVELFGFFGNEAAAAIANAQLFSEFKVLFMSTVRTLAEALEAKDEYTGGHAERVSHFATIVAQEMGMPPSEVENIALAALLHDIGKIGVPEEILTKPAKVTEAEFEEIKKHPAYGFKILEPLDQLGRVLPGIMHHHERWDGKGYPYGLKGEEIPLAARIVSVVDALDAMTSTRPYRKALPDEVALTRLKESAGTQFDPTVTEVLLNAYQKGLIVTANHAPKAA